MTEIKSLQITELGSRGDGVGAHGGKSVYVPFTVPGDVLDVKVVEEKKSQIRAMPLAWHTDGPQRKKPNCAHFGRCGGCALQHIKPRAYQAWIAGRIHTALSHQGIEAADIATPVLSPPESRRRTVWKAVRDKGNGEVTLGYFEEASHTLVNITECPVLLPALFDLVAPLRRLLAGLLTPGEGAEVQATATETGVQMVIRLPRQPGPDALMQLAQFAQAQDLAELYAGEKGYEEPVALLRPAETIIGRARVVLPPGSFVQATREGEGALQSFAFNRLAGAGHVADYFSGIGTFALLLAEEARVHAVDADEKLLAACKSAADRAGLHGLETEQRDLFRRPPTVKELSGFDGLVFDPPRAGAARLADSIAGSGVPRVIAISCNPNTFARDARTLLDGGYGLERILPVGQFLWSRHVELAASFMKG